MFLNNRLKNFCFASQLSTKMILPNSQSDESSSIKMLKLKSTTSAKNFNILKQNQYFKRQRKLIKFTAYI